MPSPNEYDTKKNNCAAWSASITDTLTGQPLKPPTTNAVAESQIRLYKAELTRPGGPLRGVPHVKLERLNWVDFSNNERPTKRPTTSPSSSRGPPLRYTKRVHADRFLSHQTQRPDSSGRFAHGNHSSTSRTEQTRRSFCEGDGPCTRTRAPLFGR